jgi:hypothetical protein
MTDEQLQREAEKLYPLFPAPSQLNLERLAAQTAYITGRKVSAAEGEVVKPKILEIEPTVSDLFPESNVASKRWSIFDQRKGAQILLNEIRRNPSGYLKSLHPQNGQWVSVETANLECEKYYVAWKKGYEPEVMRYNNGPGTIGDWHQHCFAPSFCPTHILVTPLPSPPSQQENKNEMI